MPVRFIYSLVQSESRCKFCPLLRVKMARVPYDVQALIVEQLSLLHSGDPRSMDPLTTATLVCRDWRILAQTHLFRAVSLGSSCVHAFRLRITIAANPGLGKYVRKVSFTSRRRRVKRAHLQQPRIVGDDGYEDDVVALLACCPNIAAFEFIQGVNMHMADWWIFRAAAVERVRALHLEPVKLRVGRMSTVQLSTLLSLWPSVRSVTTGTIYGIQGCPLSDKSLAPKALEHANGRVRARTPPVGRRLQIHRMGSPHLLDEDKENKGIPDITGACNCPFD
ncbi:hypothetical protein FA95DRAFT_521711 [Auriscalpium vulgare]|uniref:Uncharacterized protein n=1 Tax=Auriscalpium vulgare TaxID=40419 RepID=A0ACB8S314_9AGAM|nr:hypothetical protein FA95DRAFT_521711 [Auriscalpium vulgare]